MKRATRCVVSGSSSQHPEFPGAVRPIDPSTAYLHIEDELQAYPRYFNTPNQAAVARTIADLEGAKAGIVFASGMAAISTTLSALLPRDSHAIFLSGLYGGSQAWLESELPQRSVSWSVVGGELSEFADAIQDNTRVIYLESPTNPLLNVVDLPAIAELAKQHDVVTVIDNTFASPINQNPIEHGIDVVIHSGTKYLGGHSDLCCGAVATSELLGAQITRQAKLLGGSLNALSVYLLERSIKTLDVRVRRQTESAAVLADFLSEHSLVERTHYPGLASHPGHAIAARQMREFGAMLAFSLQPHLDPKTFLRELQIIRPALSLGGTESSICIPATTSHRDVDPAILEAAGITPGLLRFSVGLEDLSDLQDDLDYALQRAQASIAASPSS